MSSPSMGKFPKDFSVEREYSLVLLSLGYPQHIQVQQFITVPPTAPPFPFLPVLESESDPVSEPQKKRRKRVGGSVVTLEPQEHPEWLPDGWRVERRMRTGGNSAGHVDKFYYSPEDKQFRSKREVLQYLETGERRKSQNNLKKKQMNANTTGLESSSALLDTTYPWIGLNHALESNLPEFSFSSLY